MSKHRPPTAWTLETKLLIWIAAFTGVVWLLSQTTTWL